MKVNKQIDFDKITYKDGKPHYHDVPLVFYTNQKREVYTEINGHRFYMTIGGMPLKSYTYKNPKKMTLKKQNITKRIKNERQSKNLASDNK